MITTMPQNPYETTWQPSPRSERFWAQPGLVPRMVAGVVAMLVSPVAAAVAGAIAPACLALLQSAYSGDFLSSQATERMLGGALLGGFLGAVTGIFFGAALGLYAGIAGKIPRRLLPAIVGGLALMAGAMLGTLGGYILAMESQDFAPPLMSAGALLGGIVPAVAAVGVTILVVYVRSALERRGALHASKSLQEHTAGDASLEPHGSDEASR